MKKFLKGLGIVVLLLLLVWLVLFLLPKPQNFALDNPMMKEDADSLPILIAHGGGNREFPDNTLEAFYNAYSVDPRAMMETDVSITKDGVVILSHDVRLDRKTNVTGEIADWNYTELIAQKVDFGYTNKTKSQMRVDGSELVKFTTDDGKTVTPLDVTYPEGVQVDNEADKQIYAKNGYNVVVDTRPADTLAEVEVYCISNDGKETTISYEEYLSLSEVARLNFDYKLRYTGKELVLDDKAVAEYRAYVEGLGGDVRAKSDKAALDLSAGEITQDEYNRVIYEAYFTSYYPEIGAYESTSKVPLLRNYYYHEYISKNISNYLFIFDDYITASFKTASGIDVSFYGFYSELGDGAVVREGASSAEARASVDGFITGSFGANWFLNAYAYLVNTVSIAPFIALMILVATLLGYSVMKLKGVESIASLGEMLKVVGSFVWFSGAVSALGSVAISFFVSRGLINALPPVLFFVTLLARSIVFTVIESRRYREQAEQKTESTEV